MWYLDSKSFQVFDLYHQVQMKALNLCPMQLREQVGIWRVKLPVSQTIKNSELFRPNGLK